MSCNEHYGFEIKDSIVYAKKIISGIVSIVSYLLNLTYVVIIRHSHKQLEG